MPSTSSILNLAKITYPDGLQTKSKALWKYRLRFILRAAIMRTSVKKLQSGIKPEMLDTLLKQHHNFFEKPMKPYITVKGSPDERADFVVSHYNFVEKCLPEETTHAIYQQQNGLELAHFEVKDEEFRLALMYDSRYQKEGDMTLKLLDNQNLAFYAVSFSIREGSNGRELAIGGIQGPESSPENKVRIKALTKTLHGLRPKDLMIKMLTIIANVWQVDHLLAVKNSAHIYRARRYHKGKVKADYDAHWKALNATDYNRDFVELSKTEVRKTPEEISRPKRAMYRRRYEWLDLMTEKLSQELCLTTQTQQ
ncbi:VirK/YbjX family protein [Photobacterium sp. J15]|uniref:VirK/YbjX family protein n=1 Tax=Photobacterium sp. J15 TaxID=265901 RepID=UPI0007E4491D|nr:VirK/YbjX family protein [Photobacterium sp. J15]